MAPTLTDRRENVTEFVGEWWSRWKEIVLVADYY